DRQPHDLFRCQVARLSGDDLSLYPFQRGMTQELWWYLPEYRKSRRPRRARKRPPLKFDRDVSILFRPDDVAHRRQFGH
ncbi:MAG: hypothetical protein AAFQ12_10635, partial [Pseudomonadota bacterium]